MEREVFHRQEDGEEIAAEGGKIWFCESFFC